MKSRHKLDAAELEAFIRRVESLKREEKLALPAIAERLSIPVGTVRDRLRVWRLKERENSRGVAQPG